MQKMVLVFVTIHFPLDENLQCNLALMLIQFLEANLHIKNDHIREFANWKFKSQELYFATLQQIKLKEKYQGIYLLGLADFVV